MTLRPRRWELLLDIAELVATRSTCNRLAVGAVIARDARPLSTGYNGPPSGMDHCEHDLSDGRACELAVHAEANAIAFAARFGTPTHGTELYVTHSPCVQCAKLIINAGIRTVWYRIEYRELTGIDLLEAAGVETICDART